MTITAYPKPATAISTDQFRDFFREFIGTGALKDADLKPFGDSSGLVVKFAAGMAVIDGVAVKSTVTESRSVDAGSGGGLSRVDTLVADLDFSANPIIQFVVLKGTPAASNPAPPSLALTGSIVYRWPLADIAVSPTAATITADNVIDRRTLVRKAPGLWSTATRPASPRDREFGFNTTTSKWEQWNSTTWVDLIPTSFEATAISDSTAVGRALVKAADEAAARTAIGATTVGSSVLTAANVISARETLRIFKGNGPGSPQVDDLRYRDA